MHRCYLGATLSKDLLKDVSMNQEIEVLKFKSRLYEVVWLAFLAGLAILGIIFVIIGTGASTVGRYFSPPEILPGFIVLNFCALLMAGSTAKKISSFTFLKKFREFIVKKINRSEREKLRNMVLILTFFIVAFSMTKGVNSRSQVFANNYYFGLIINVSSSILDSIGLFGWLSSLLISKQSKEKS